MEADCSYICLNINSYVYGKKCKCQHSFLQLCPTRMQAAVCPTLLGLNRTVLIYYLKINYIIVWMSCSSGWSWKWINTIKLLITKPFTELNRLVEFWWKKSNKQISVQHIKFQTLLTIFLHIFLGKFVLFLYVS